MSTFIGTILIIGLLIFIVWCVVKLVGAIRARRKTKQQDQTKDENKQDNKVDTHCDD